MVVWKGFTWQCRVPRGTIVLYVLVFCQLYSLVGTQQQPPPQQQQHQQHPPPQQQQQHPPPQQQQPPPQQYQQQHPPQQQQQHPPPQQFQQQQPPPQQFQQQQPPSQQFQQQQQHPPPQQQFQQQQQHPPPQQQFQQQPPPQQQFQQQPPVPHDVGGQHPPPVQHHPVVSLQDIPEHDRPWYEMLPAVAMDYKVHIDAGKEDCYFQYVQQGSTLYVSFHVIRGGDGMAGFAVRNPRGEIVHPYQWQASSDYTDGAAMGGFYAVCIDNQFSRFASKLVNLYITVIRYEEWEKFTKEIEDLNVNMNNFTGTISTVERNLNAMFQYQAHSRNNEARDYALILDNNAYIWKWSVLQILVIVFTTSVQVYFVRKLFDIKTGSGKSRI
ncbi:transmembrane emp24 domain-containing protein 5 [Anopheles moucheti]|uniref:transmembrane emp24 domain-containing protein 5 n=1 Tax=Anopheles moucheti TaxID=186751 RepID=UPI0022F03AC3|nr:transmembrane emp24 domain-containing protein 5 [Anopheles moucheti]